MSAPAAGGVAQAPAVDVPAVLGAARERVDPVLRAAVARLDPAARTQSAHHLGWTDGRGAGKAVRPALALLAARAVGDDVGADAALHGAAALELVHNFSLVHDDLMDGDVERRHRPTVWARWGTSAAVLTGDAMLALAAELVLESPSAHAARAAHVLAVAVRELVRGQADDVAFESRDDVTVRECLAMAEGKTGALLAASTEVGAVLAGGTPAEVAALRTAGAELGVAFQLVDDLLGIWGDPAVTGKPVLADLRIRKKSLPITWAARHGGSAGRELGTWLARTDDPDPTERSLHHAAALVERAGGRRWAVAEADRRRRAAEKALGAVPTPTADRASAVAALRALGRHLAHRES